MSTSEPQASDALRPQNDRLLTAADVADHLQIPERTLAAWRLNGTGPTFVRVGKYVRYQRRDLEAWIENLAEAS